MNENGNICTVKFSVAERLKERGMSTQDLVNAAGSTYPTILGIVQNRSTQVRLETIAKICLALDVGISEIIDVSYRRASND